MTTLIGKTATFSPCSIGQEGLTAAIFRTAERVVSLAQDFAPIRN